MKTKLNNTVQMPLLIKGSLFFFGFFAIFAFSATPAHAQVLNFTQAYTTLTNSRLSYYAKVGTTTGANATNVIIANSGNPDNNTYNIWPNDVLCFNNPASNGCSSQATYTVASTPTSTQIAVTSAIANALTAGTAVVSTQSARLTVTFTPRTAIASGGYIRLSVASATSNYNDGIPDNSGFDVNKLTTGNINTYVTPTGFTKSAATLTYGAGYNVILMTLSSALNAGSSYSFVVGDVSDTTLRFINPAPSGTTHTRGIADSYSIILQTEDSSNNPQDKTITKVAPVDGVFVSATVEETISYTIAGVNVSTSACGTTTSVTSTASSVPFGSIINTNTFYDAAQTHAITTNSANGYVLTAQYDQALSLNGAGVTTIPDTSCDTSCTTGTPAAWATATNNGFGYTLANITGTEAAFTNASGYKPFSSSAVTIMTKSSSTSGSQIYSCPRLSVSTSQQTGTYFNKLTYVATPKF
ncbi:MAG: hypothetical protein NUV65_06065 [Candidatus Roizmanbacteria bacterium]|nr:hypothetical protein [Candidatus Roizmanbacteria bacterium]